MTMGNVGKASYSDFAGKRKLLIIPFVTPTRPDQELLDLVTTYWADAFGQVMKLEAGMGSVAHVFHEGSVGGGEEALEVLEKGNPLGFSHLKEVIGRGASLEPTEEVECLKEMLDLHRCMSAVQASARVRDRLLVWFEESRTSRYAAIAERVERHMADNSVGILVISPDHEVKFGESVEVVSVVPPVLDRINRWLRDHPGDGPDLSDLQEELEDLVEAEQAAGGESRPADDETPGWAKT
jgi:hypothetical protein